MQDYKKLKIWEISRDLSVEIYQLTNKFPRHEKFGVTNQIRRSSTSIPANITEGAGKVTQKDFAKYVSNSIGSINELETFLSISNKLNYLEDSELNEFEEKYEHLKRMLINFIKKLQSDRQTSND